MVVESSIVYKKIVRTDGGPCYTPSMTPYRSAFLSSVRVAGRFPRRLSDDAFEAKSISPNTLFAQNIGVVLATSSASLLTILGMGSGNAPVENMLKGFLAAGLLTIGGITAYSMIK